MFQRKRGISYHLVCPQSVRTTQPSPTCKGHCLPQSHPLRLVWQDSTKSEGTSGAQPLQNPPTSHFYPAPSCFKVGRGYEGGREVPMTGNPLVSQLPHRTLPVGGWVNNCAQPVHVCVEEGHMMGKSKIKKHKTVSLSLNIITRDMLWVVGNGEELVQKRKTLQLGASWTPQQCEELQQRSCSSPSPRGGGRSSSEAPARKAR